MYSQGCPILGTSAKRRSLEGAHGDAVCAQSFVVPDRTWVSALSLSRLRATLANAAWLRQEQMGLVVGAGVAVWRLAAGAYMFLGKNKTPQHHSARPPKVTAAAPATPAEICILDDSVAARLWWRRSLVQG